MAEDVDPAIVAALAKANGTAAPEAVDPAILAALGHTPHPGILHSFATGLGQSAFGLGDEAGAALQASSEPKFGNILPTYRQARFENRQIDKAAREDHPIAYWGGLGAGILGTAPLFKGAQGGSLASRVGTTALSGFAQGGVFGAGNSEADVTRGQLGPLLKDVGTYAGTGGLLAGGTGLLGEGLGALARSAGGRRVALRASVEAQKALEEAEKIKSLGGIVGGITQKGSRYLENFQRWADNPSIPQELRDSMRGFLGSEEGRALTSSVLGNQLEEAPKVLGQRSAAIENLAQAQAEAPAAAQKAADATLSPAEAWNQIQMRAMRYGPLATLGGLAGHFGGHSLTSLVGGAGLGYVARPTIQALVRMAKHPAVKNLARGATEGLSGFGANVLGAGGTPAIEGGALNVFPFPQRPAAQMSLAADAQDPDIQKALALASALRSREATQ